MIAAEPEIVVLADADAVSAAAADRLATALVDAVGARGRADWATTGGSAAPGIYRRLAVPPLRSTIPWGDVHVWWGDDRFVPSDHPYSNVQPVDQILLGMAALAGESGTGEGGADVELGIEPGAPIPPDNVRPFPISHAIGASEPASACAQAYGTTLHAAGLEVRNALPVFDVVLLGVGPDGHILSVFPGSTAFDSDSWALAIPAPTHVEPHVERVTLNPGIVEVARRVLVVVSGAGKADIIGEVFGGTRDPRRLPAQLALRANAVWVLDRDAAARLPN
ncbi:MAG TPA: 6-phosphogluconolactonase [Candidatus Limnocylindrales bacterium]|jgi:6-phosphogluconolactonase